MSYQNRRDITICVTFQTLHQYLLTVTKRRYTNDIIETCMHLAHRVTAKLQRQQLLNEKDLSFA